MIGGYREDGELTPRLVIVLELAADGLTVAEAAAQLRRSPATIETERRALMVRLGARNITHAVAIGYRRGIIGHIG